MSNWQTSQDYFWCHLEQCPRHFGQSPEMLIAECKSPISRG